MRIKELILELLNEDINDQLYFRFEDEQGRIVYFTPEGVCCNSDRFKDAWGVKYTTVNLNDA